MTGVAPEAAAVFDWEAAGHDLGASIDRLNAVAVLGSNESDTARVALGMARQQARKRRVAIGDLLGDAEPLRALVTAEDPPGLADVFEFGVSLHRIAQPVADEDNLIILPSGAFITDQAEIMAHRRWSRLASGFREEDGLLIVVASVAAPDVEALVIQLDGAILVGDLVPARLPVARVLGSVRGPQSAFPTKPAEPRPPTQYVVESRRSWRTGAAIGAFLTIMIAAIGVWLAARPFADSPWAPRWLRGNAPRGLFAEGDSTQRDTAALNAARMGLFTRQDSASVAPFAIGLVTFNTQAGALLELRRNSATLRAGTFTPVLIRETHWFRVIAGAYPDSASAAALLDTLRSRGLGDAGRAEVERFPYALLIERDVPDSAVASRVSGFQTRGLPVYALLQSDGTARLFAGAFRTRDESRLLADVMTSAGIRTSLVYRTGRVY